MRKLLITVLCWVAVGLSAALPDQFEGSRAMDTETIRTGMFNLETSNYGCQTDMFSSWGTKLLFNSGCWISGKRVRRDAAGRRLYWMTYPPSAENSQLTYEGSPDWTPDLVVVQDTLTTVAFDGDLNLFELLPAYNPRLIVDPEHQDEFELFNQQDRVLLSIMGSPAPIPFDPFNSQDFLFSIPQPGTFPTPGFQTYSAYYYDYCPFGSPGDRDYGSSSSSSTHYPLGLAVHQESYTWNLQNHDKFLINKYTIYNTNDLDSIEDLAISYYVDSDVGPAGYGPELASDDVSGYVKGQGYEFAYTRDADQDGGLAPDYLASKLIIPGFDGYNHDWFWRVGDGPNDSNPRSLNFSPRRTSNEKYWLATGRNPNENEYIPLRPEEEYITEYEQPQPNDTRYLNTLFGAQPNMPGYNDTDAQGNYINRVYLAPHDTLSFYSVLFLGNSLDELKARSIYLEDFFNDGMQIDETEGLACLPYLLDPIPVLPDCVNLNWFSYTNPDHFELAYKEYGEPAANWNITNLPGSYRNYSLVGLDPNLWYEIKLGSVYFNPSEVYLESDVKLINISSTVDTDDPVSPVVSLSNYPNPFSGSTTIRCELKEPTRLSLEVFNLRGQRVRSLQRDEYARGLLQQSWDGRDDGGNQCGSGIYYLRLKTDSFETGLKMLLIK